MSELIKCPACKGVKIVMGVGGMRKNCTDCVGVGWISVNKATNTEGVSPSEIDNLKSDLAKMIEAYEASKAENQTLQDEIKKLKKVKKK